MFLVSFPSMMIVLLLLYIFILPHFYSDYVSTTISTTNNYYGFDMFDNETNTLYRPIDRVYSWASQAVGYTHGVPKVNFPPDNFFEHGKMTINLWDEDGTTGLVTPPKAWAVVEFQNTTHKIKEIDVIKNATGTNTYLDLENIIAKLGLKTDDDNPYCPIPSRIHYALAFPEGVPQEQLYVSLKKSIPTLKQVNPDNEEENTDNTGGLEWYGTEIESYNMVL